MILFCKLIYNREKSLTVSNLYNFSIKLFCKKITDSGNYFTTAAFTIILVKQFLFCLLITFPRHPLIHIAGYPSPIPPSKLNKPTLLRKLYNIAQQQQQTTCPLEAKVQEVSEINKNGMPSEGGRSAIHHSSTASSFIYNPSGTNNMYYVIEMAFAQAKAQGAVIGGKEKDFNAEGAT